MVHLPTVEETVAKIKAEVLDDIASGILPPDPESFSALHDYVDANTYGGMCDDGIYEAGHDEDGEPNETADEWLKRCNAASDAVDAWLKAGRPAGEPVRITIYATYHGTVDLTVADLEASLRARLEEVYVDGGPVALNVLGAEIEDD